MKKTGETLKPQEARPEPTPSRVRYQTQRSSARGTYITTLGPQTSAFSRSSSFSTNERSGKVGPRRMSRKLEWVVKSRPETPKSGKRWLLRCPPGAEVPATNPELLDHISQNSAGKRLQRGVTVAAVYGTTRVYELWTTCPRMQGWVRVCLPARALDYMSHKAVCVCVRAYVRTCTGYSTAFLHYTSPEVSSGKRTEPCPPDAEVPNFPGFHFPESLRRSQAVLPFYCVGLRRV